MDKLISVLQIIVPIFAAIGLGIFARRKELLTQKEVKGFQQFVMNFGLPCTLFNSCLTSSFGTETVTSMALVLPTLLISSLWAFRFGKKKYAYHNFPFLFTAKESGMVGIPLFMTLFGVDQAYRMGILDVAQSLIAIPVLAILSAASDENPTVKGIVGQVFRSPLLIMSLLGLTLNLTGIADILDRAGVLPVITETTGFLAQPVSALMLFSVGYNFSLGGGNRKTIFRICGIHCAYFAAACVVIQGVLCLLPQVDAGTRWALLLYCALPASYISPSLGRTEEDATIASGVCSILTIACLLVFCVAAALVV